MRVRARVCVCVCVYQCVSVCIHASAILGCKVYRCGCLRAFLFASRSTSGVILSLDNYLCEDCMWPGPNPYHRVFSVVRVYDIFSHPQPQSCSVQQCDFLLCTAKGNVLSYFTFQALPWKQCLPFYHLVPLDSSSGGKGTGSVCLRTCVVLPGVYLCSFAAARCLCLHPFACMLTAMWSNIYFWRQVCLFQIHQFRSWTQF